MRKPREYLERLKFQHNIPHRTLNMQKYLKAPTAEQVKKVIDACQVPMTHLERFFGIPKGNFKQILYGGRNLPIKYWHIIYETLHKIETGEPITVFNPDNPFFKRPPRGDTRPKKPKKPQRTKVKKDELVTELL